jgi:hypothetical protein
MTQFSSRNYSWRATHEIFIWGQLALLAGVPWLWVMALRGLACGDLWLPPLLELWFLLVPTVGLTAWLQWSKPLSPFSWWFAAVPCQDLTENQLRVFDFLSPKTNPSLATGWLGVLVGITNVVVMSWSLRFLPSLQTESVIDNHFFGVTIALLCLWLANFWLQASVSALRILLAAKSIGEGTSFYTRESVPQDFTHLGVDDVLINWIGVPKKALCLPEAQQPLVIVPTTSSKLVASEIEPTGLTQPDTEIEIESTGLTQPDTEIEIEPTGLTQTDTEIEIESTGLTQPDTEIEIESTGLIQTDTEIEIEPTGLTQTDTEIEIESTGLTQPDTEIEIEPTGLTQTDTEIEIEPTGLTQTDTEIEIESTGLIPTETVVITIQPEIPNHNDLMILNGDISSSLFAGDPDPDDPGALPTNEFNALMDEILGIRKPNNQ